MIGRGAWRDGLSGQQPPLPAEHYRRHAARIRQLANEATTAVVKEHLREVAVAYERLAERAVNGALPTSP